MSEGDVIIRVVRSDGEKMMFGRGDWRIPNNGLNNFANLTHDVSYVELPSYDGAIVTAKRIGSVDRTFTAEASRPSDNERLRAEAIAFFNPKYSFKCYLRYEGRTRFCEGEQIGFKCSEYNIYRPIQITWTVLCANPFMMGEGINGENILAVDPRFGFPYATFAPLDDSQPKVGKGGITGVYLFERKVRIDNDGDVPSALRVEIRATGKVVNPAIRIGNKFVRVKVEMRRGDVFELDAMSRPPQVRFNGENAMNKLDRGSSILDMKVDVGKTTVLYDADDGISNSEVYLYWYQQYLGI